MDCARGYFSASRLACCSVDVLFEVSDRDLDLVCHDQHRRYWISATCDQLHQNFSSLENVNFEALGSSELCSCYTQCQFFMHRETTMSSCFTEDYCESAAENDGSAGSAFQCYHQTSENENKEMSQSEYLARTVSCDQLFRSSEHSWPADKELSVLGSASMILRIGRLRLACESMLSLPFYPELEPPYLPRYSSSRRAIVSQSRKRMSRTRFLKYSLPGLDNISKSYDFSTLGVKDSSHKAKEGTRYPSCQKRAGHYRSEISDIEGKRLGSRSLVHEGERLQTFSADLEVGRFDSDKFDSEEITESDVIESFDVEPEQRWSCSNDSDPMAEMVKKSYRNVVDSDLGEDSCSGLSDYSHMSEIHRVCEEKELEASTSTQRSCHGTVTVKVGEYFDLHKITPSYDVKHTYASGKRMFKTLSDISDHSGEVVLPDGNGLEMAAEDSDITGKALVTESHLPTSSTQGTLNDQVNGMMFLPVYPKPCLHSFVGLALSFSLTSSCNLNCPNSDFSKKFMLRCALLFRWLTVASRCNCLFL